MPGLAVTVLPRSRAEDSWFREWRQTHRPAWTEADRRPGARLGEPDHVWSTFPAPLPSAEGYRIVWVHSSAKATKDATARQARIEAAVAAMEDLTARLAKPKCRLRTTVAVEQAAAAALTAAGASRWLRVAVSQVTIETFRQEGRGRPGATARYRKYSRTSFQLSYDIDRDLVAYDAATDGCFPTITNDPQLPDAEVLAAYHYQPNLERRHHLLKGVQLVAPVFLHDPVRIEGLLCCHFLAMLVQALIEREIRRAMDQAQLDGIPLYPELRACPAPSAARVLEIFASVARHRLLDAGRLVKVFQPTLTPLQLQCLDLLGIPVEVYTGTSPSS